MSCCVTPRNYSFGGVSQGQTLDEIKAILEKMLEEMSNDDYFSDSLWEAPNGDVVIKRVVRADDGSITTEFINPDGSAYTGSLTDLKPYSRQVIVDKVDYCANNIPYSFIQFRNHDTKQVVATIWRNDEDFSESATAPIGATKGGCKEAVTYQVQVSLCFTNGTERLKVMGVQTETAFIPLVTELSTNETLFPIGLKPDLTGFNPTKCISCCN